MLLSNFAIYCRDSLIRLCSNGDIQCGFRKRKSTVRLESFIRDAFLNKQEVVSVFFDLEKAYDTTWKYGILRDIHEAGLRRRMPIFISKFLENRNFKVRLGSILSDTYEQEMEYPKAVYCR